MQDNIEDHDRGLAFDLRTLSRRRMLGWCAGAGGAVLLAGCGGEDAVTTATAGTTTTGTTGGTTTGTTTTTPTTGSAACIADPNETAGPYPADGTNSAQGATSNVLTASGVVRRDLRTSFLSSTTVASGVAMTLVVTVVNVNAGCAPLAGYAVYLWHCDQDGHYSLYDLPGESYLRGVQLTDANGQVTFTTIVPGCYAGRYPHMHFEVFASIADATSGRNAKLTSQLAMPRDACAAVYAAGGYAGSASRLATITTASDNVFGDNSTAQIAAQTPAMTGSPSAGYAATVTVGLAL
jgi:protocatechuate 3,4-dioxygenase beta subunit